MSGLLLPRFLKFDFNRKFNRLRDRDDRVAIAQRCKGRAYNNTISVEERTFIFKRVHDPTRAGTDLQRGLLIGPYLLGSDWSISTHSSYDWFIYGINGYTSYDWSIVLGRSWHRAIVMIGL